jgi:hypothetical protein
MSALLASHPQLQGRANATRESVRLVQAKELLKTVELLEESVQEYLDWAYIEFRDGLPVGDDINPSQNRLF